MTKERTKFWSGIAMGLAGVLIITGSVVAVAKNPSLLSAAKTYAVTPTVNYSGNWIVSKKRRLRLTEVPGSCSDVCNIVASQDVGASEWKVRYCIGGKGVIRGGGNLDVGNCDPSGDGIETEVNETWAVPSDGWAIPPSTGSSWPDKFKLDGIDVNHDSTSSTFKNDTDDTDEGGCEGTGVVYPSGLYGILWTTTDDRCQGNGPRLWWAYSQVPLRWHVTGTVKYYQ